MCESISFLHAAIPTRLDSRRIVDVLGNAYGEQAAKRGEAWVEVLGKEYVNDQQKLQSINQFFNQLEFSTDQKIWGENNYWATPLEFIGANAGDCEDFALAKYFSLLELGIKDERLRIVMVKAMMINQYHMVLAYYPSPTVEPLILDNLIGEIKVASERKDLIPIYSFNGKQLWLNKKRIQGVVAGKSSRLKRWDDLNRRMGLKNLRQPVTNME
ncbi:transglutaminase-like cysteine peptidase [Psychromonas algarum]|uniref:transglutaminase-like cysteine peptidase n=1 Tax=Psychromonas algarum TaxID=2555643 RepID=UPI001FB967A7|nr:transglutaminase-like cysteine peptidase [Psychromonas sp. RZ22]